MNKRFQNNIVGFICVMCILILSACTALGPHYNITYRGKKFKTYSIYRPFVGMADYRGGYWGDWYKETQLRYEVKNTYPGFEITYYNKYSHPSDFQYKIIVKKSLPRDGSWEVFEGEFQVRKDNESSMRSKYTKEMSGVNALKDVWSFPAKIKRTYDKLPEEKYIFPKLPTEMMYVYNVYYNGVGRAFDISGSWIGADQYDPW